MIRPFINKTQNQRVIAILIVLVVASIGTYLLTGSHAQTPYVSATADSGTLASGATQQICSGSSDGNCVAFGGSSPSGKIIGINGTFWDPNYDYTINAAQMGAQWSRDAVWGDDAQFKDVCPSEFNFSAATNCGTQQVLNANAKNGIRVLLLLDSDPGGSPEQKVDFENQGTCSTSTDYNTCLSSCSLATYTGTCTSQLEWVHAAVYTAVNYGQGGTFWKGRTDLGSNLMELGNEVYNPLETSGPWSCVYDTITVNGQVLNECFDPADYARMVKLVSIAVTAATSGQVKTIFDSEPQYTTDTQGDSGEWPQAMQAAVPDLANYVGGVSVHPYGDIASIGVCANNPCTTPTQSRNFSYPNNLNETHTDWPTLPVYVTEVGQQTQYVGNTEQCKAINQYFDDFRKNSWEAGLWIYSQQGTGTGYYELIQGPDSPGKTGTLLPAWFAYQSQALHQTDYAC